MRPTNAPGAGPTRVAKRALTLAVTVGLCVAAFWEYSPSLSDAPRATIEELNVANRNGGTFVSFRVSGTFTDEVLERLHSGIELTFKHRVDLLGKKIAWVFPHRVLGRTVVSTSARYDPLTRRYDLRRELIGKNWPKGIASPEQLDESSTASLEEVESWMTVLNEVPLPGPRATKAIQLKVRVRSEVGRRFILLLFPSTYAATGEVALEF